MFFYYCLQIKMNGPEAASIMRNSLQYSGPIVGTLLGPNTAYFAH